MKKKTKQNKVKKKTEGHKILNSNPPLIRHSPKRIKFASGATLEKKRTVGTGSPEQ